MVNLALVETARLTLARPTRADLNELHKMCSDPLVWEHFPSLRHTDRAQTEDQLRRYQRGWDEHGLSSWVARTRSFQESGQLIGVGGVSIGSARYWNLSYRLARHTWGNGYAQEVIAAARAAATQANPALPVVAYLLEHNVGSKRAAERAGLDLAWRGPDPGNPDSSAVRLVFADRELDDPLLDALVYRR